MTNTTTELERQIEQMVAAHVAALQKAAQDAVERAFAAAKAGAPTVAASRPRAARAASKRRGGAELSALVLPRALVDGRARGLDDGITPSARVRAQRDAWWSGDGGGVGVRLENGLDDVALDKLALATRTVSERVVGDAVDVVQGSRSGLVNHGGCVRGEKLLGGAGGEEARANVLGGVVRRERLDAEPVGKAGVERAASAHEKALVEVGQADQDEREQGFAVPCVVEQDVEVVEGILVNET
jgi:hypothetical protein